MIKARTSIPSNSKSDKNWYSDHEISAIKKDAFDQGSKHFTDIYLKEFLDCISNIQQKSKQFFDEVKENCNIQFKQIRLKAEPTSSFVCIFVMSQKDYKSEKSLRCVTNFGLDFIDKHIESNVSVLFSYMPSDNVNELNQNEFLLNGFDFTYDPFR